MKILKTRAEVKEYVSQQRQQSLRLALVPTMGSLHQGHLSLVKIARMQAPRVVVSIFVNPSQFNDPKDLEKYPRDLDRDCALLETVGTSAVFAPADALEIYPAGFQTWVQNESLSQRYEGASRPGHFRGVATVVTILFNLLRADLAVFGEKDFQQLRVVEQLVKDLALETQVVRAPIARDPDGLAMSSRNARLSAAGRQKALALSRGLRIAHDAYRGGQRDATFLCSLVRDAIALEGGIVTDYVSLVDEQSLEALSGVVRSGRLLLAATVDGVRLIDNMQLGG